MPASLSVEDRLFAANQLLIRVNQLRDSAENGSFLSPRPSPIELWLSDFEKSFVGASKPFTPAVDRLLSLLQTERNQGNADRAAPQLIEALESAIRALSQAKSLEQAILSRVEQAIYDFAYGLSHEINNPLANISARAQQLILDCKDERSRKSLATIVDQSQRAYEMLAEMMQVVKPQPIAIEKTDLQEAIQTAVGRVAPLCESAQIQLEIEPNIPSVLVDSNKAGLPEVLVMLLSNGAEASRPGDLLQLEVSLLSTNPFASELRAIPGGTDSAASPAAGEAIRSGIPTGALHRSPNGHRSPHPCFVELRIVDTGCGMDVNTAKNAFNVYFSGREYGRGLGVSLAKAKRLIEAAGGAIRLESTETSGTRVLLLLPISGDQNRPSDGRMTSKLFS